MIKKIQPVIKWSGSKRTQALEITSYFPKEINTYREEFCGGASILGQLLIQENIHINHFICSDINEDLINLWLAIKMKPEKVYEHYNRLWIELNKDDNKDRKRKFFEEVRKEYNINHNELDFMFIMRTTTNGMPRYNKNGEFNNSFHITRNGITPYKLQKIIYEWSDLLNKKDVEFVCSSYEKFTNLNENDFLYLDPPYANTKGMYYGSIDNNKLFEYLRNIKCKYALSFDGKGDTFDNTYNVPNDIYSRHVYIKSGNSSFRRVIGNNKNEIIYESLYLNY